MPKKISPDCHDDLNRLGRHHHQADEVTSPGRGILVLHKVQQKPVIVVKYKRYAQGSTEEYLLSHWMLS